MDFVSDRIFDGRPFRILTVVDCHTREALSLTPRANFRAYQVTEALDALVKLRGRPKSLRGRQWAGVRRSHARPVGLPERGRDRLLTTGQADRQRLRRVVQRPPTGGMPERFVVPISG